MTDRGNVLEAALIRDFIHAALDHAAASDRVVDLLHQRVALGRYHRTVVSAMLKPILEEIIDAATDEDWRAITSDLIADTLPLLAIH